MLLRKTYPLFFTLLSLFSIAQNSWYHYDWDKSSPKDFAGLYQYLYHQNLSRYKDNIYIGQHYERFSKECAAETNGDILNGEFYKDFGYDTYLRKVLCTVIPDTSISNHIKIILVREDDLNASMDESGVLRLNMGHLARANNEAELAMMFGHEVAHFINEDRVKNYGRRIEMENGHSSHFGIGGYMFGGNTEADHYWFNREQEGMADFSSIKFMMKSPYSLKSGANLFRQFKRLDVRGDLKYGKDDGTWSTHPDPGDRLKQVKFLSVDSINRNKKNFVVDSLVFFQLKEKCFDETVNICLQKNHIYGLMDLCFARYLFEPTNQNNLAVLIEAIRRAFIFDKKEKLENESFILNQYQTKHVRNSENYNYLNQDHPSILKYLTKGFIDLGKEDVPKIKAIELLDSTQIEFTTYKEAFNYFVQKAKDLNCKVCEHYKYFAKNQDFSDVNNFVAANTLFETNDFITTPKGVPEGAKDIFVVLPTNLTKVSYILNRKSLEEEMDFYDQIVKGLEAKMGVDVLKLDELPYLDQHLLKSLFAHCYYFLDLKENRGVKNENTDWPELAPELYSFFKRNNVKNIYLCYVNLFLGPEKKSYESFQYYKITLPTQGNTFSGEIKQGIADQHEGYKWYIDKLTSQFSGFYKITK